MEYTVVYDSYLPGFIAEVNRRLAEGWRCAGGIDNTTTAFYQAMVREKKDETQG